MVFENNYPSGSIAIVTGASEGIGFATAKWLALSGVEVVLAARNAKNLERAADKLSALGVPAQDIHIVPMDAGDEASRIAGLKTIAGRFSGVSILVNNAGIVVPPAAFDANSMKALRASMEVNLFGILHISQALLPEMRANGWGRIVNIASTAGLGAPKGLMSYSVSKAALISFTKSLAMDLAETGVTANSVSPGPVVTNSYLHSKGGEGVRKRARSVPSGRLSRPEEIASVVGYLASVHASHIIGQNLVVDGGEGAAGQYAYGWLDARETLVDET